MTKKTKTANDVITEIAAHPSLDAFFAKATPTVAADDLDVVVAHYRADRAQWLASVKKKMEKKAAKGG